MWRVALTLFVGVSGIGAGCVSSLAAAEGANATGERPNILWISCEDISPNLGCYGDPVAYTPRLDSLASEGQKFTRAFTPAGVCAVVRSGIITGMYPVSIGSQHMRSRIVPPPHVHCFTESLRAAGYFCTNRSKTDYQFESPLTAWDRQGNRHRDWAERSPGQPFFSVINLTGSHESQIRHPAARHESILAGLPAAAHHDPEQMGATLPSYLPNTPASRQDWAWYHDNISDMDRQVGEILDRLAADGLAENTIVFFWSDHGQGMPRGKRWIYDSGTLVPLIIRWPGHLEPGSECGDLVTLLDLPATVLSLAGIEKPEHFHGRILVGLAQEAEPEYLFFHRDRMDEAYELMRGVRDRRFKYIRNFEPERPYAQGIDYMDLMPTMIDWRAAAKSGELTDAQAQWFRRPKPIEEFYDTQADPDEVRNLAEDPRYAERLAEFREALAEWQVEIEDLGLIPEAVLMATMKPGGAVSQTAAPQIFVESDGGGATVRLECVTPGASLAYRLDQGPWLLYTQPLQVESGTQVTARACRLGYRDSEARTRAIAN